MGKIVHGNKSFGYAPINVVGSTYSFGTPVMLKGLVNASIEVEQSETKIYADDQVYAKVKGAKARNITIALRYITDAYAEYLGYKKNLNGMLTDTGIFPNHCIFFETEEENDDGTSTQTLHYLYNVKASAPTKSSSTDEEEVSAEELQITYTGSESEFVKDDDNNYVQYGYITRTSANASVYDTFTTAVLLPTSAMSV